LRWIDRDTIHIDGPMEMRTVGATGGAHVPYHIASVHVSTRQREQA